MDQTLHCNSLKCYKELDGHGQAVVTACSHVFCLDCANKLFGSDKRCPACEAFLQRENDVVINLLDPPGDYRASALAGLTPTTAMEIATRSLNFWNYQKSQEANLQNVVLKNARERAAASEKRIQSMTTKFNTEISLIRDKTTALETELATEQRRLQVEQAAVRALGKENQILRVNMDRLKGPLRVPRLGVADETSAQTERRSQNPRPFPTPSTRSSIGSGTGPRLAFWQAQKQEQGTVPLYNAEPRGDSQRYSGPTQDPPGRPRSSVSADLPMRAERATSPSLSRVIDQIMTARDAQTGAHQGFYQESGGWPRQGGNTRIDGRPILDGGVQRLSTASTTRSVPTPVRSGLKALRPMGPHPPPPPSAPVGRHTPRSLRQVPGRLQQAHLKGIPAHALGPDAAEVSSPHWFRH